MFKHSRILFALFASLSALLLLFSACGGGDDDDSGGTDATATRTTDSGDDGGDAGGDDETETPEGDDETETPDDDGGDDDGGDDDGGVFGDGTSETCNLLTPEEVEDVLGEPVGEGEGQDLDEQFLGCAWRTETFNSVDVSVYNGPGGEDIFEFSNEDAEEIDGLGDRAQWSGGILSFLEIIKDDYYITLSVNDGDLDEEQSKEAAVALGEKVVARLD